MHLLITGAEGQLGRALRAHFSPQTRLTLWRRTDYDLRDRAVVNAVADLAPDGILNAAAWTDVDGAESDPEAVFATNALGPRWLAQGAAACGAVMVQISTNEVFSGETGHFYRESDRPEPGSVYARSKAAGEDAVRETTDRHFVVRVAWLYGPGGDHFPSKIMGAADRHGALRVVADEWGNPTYTPDVALALESLLKSKAYGTYHLVNEGYASRFEWAQKVMELSGRGDIPLTPISAEEWPRPAPPPRHAVLVNEKAAQLGIRLRPWQDALASYFETEKVSHE